ncbi:hypothetical protein HDU81_001757 [Chytriomyces hyalinus]|nr:hypothetical protein HDU81_001757 [Chytriomyces hyalinus]
MNSMQSSFTASVTFSSPTAGDMIPLCSARATVGAVLLDTCPIELSGSGAATCMRVSCQSMPGTVMVSGTVRAMFSVCPSAMVDECGTADMAIVRVVKRLGMASGTTAAGITGAVATTAVAANTVSTNGVTLNSVTTGAVATSAVDAMGNSASDVTLDEGAKTVASTTATSTLPNMVASVVGVPASTKGTDQAPNLALVIVPALVVLAAIAVGVYLYLKRRRAVLDVDAEERGQVSTIARRKGSTEKDDFQVPTTEAESLAYQPTYVSDTTTTALAASIPTNETKTKITVSTKPFNIVEPRVQPLPAGQVRYMRGAPGPILIPGPPALSPSNESPTSILGIASTYKFPNNIPSAAGRVKHSRKSE